LNKAFTIFCNDPHADFYETGGLRLSARTGRSASIAQHFFKDRYPIKTIIANRLAVLIDD